MNTVGRSQGFLNQKKFAALGKYLDAFGKLLGKHPVVQATFSKAAKFHNKDFESKSSARKRKKNTSNLNFGSYKCFTKH